MQPSDRKSILCPNCRKLISSDESRCPYCGMATPAARWKNNPLTRGWGSGRRLVRIVIYVNVGMYLFSLLISKSILASGLNPLDMLAPTARAIAEMGATGTLLINRLGWWTLISANYLHGSALHIFFNMMALQQIAVLITQLYGPYRFFTIYTLSGIGGFLISCIVGVPLTVGASAALCGLIGAALYYGRSRGGTFGQMVYRQIGGWAIGIILLGFMIPRVNNAAHIGGMLAGALCAALMGYNEKRREGIGHRILAGACMMTTVPVLLWSLFRGLLFWLGR